MSDNTTTYIDVIAILHQTDDAWKVQTAEPESVFDDKPFVWLPKSQCSLDDDLTFEVPEWLAIEKGLV